MLTAPQAAALIAVMALVTFLTRALPFLLFDHEKRPPARILALGRALPPAVMAMLIVYCLREVRFTQLSGWLPPLLAGGVTVALHLWKRNNLLSIFGGTALYMFLVQVVFV